MRARGEYFSLFEAESPLAMPHSNPLTLLFNVYPQESFLGDFIIPLKMI